MTTYLDPFVLETPRDVDRYMRGTGRLARQGHHLLWGPGWHSSGDNVYSYFAGPVGFTVEYTTALEPSLCGARRYPPAAS